MENLAPGLRRLEGAALRYVARVHRLGAGDSLFCFDPAAAVEGLAVLQRDAGGLLCDVGELHPTSYRPLPVTLIQGLAKGVRPDTTLRDATALGAQRVAFIETERGVVHVPSERAESRMARWRRIAAEAARQSGRGDLPVIEGPSALETWLAKADQPHRLVLVPGAPPLLARLARWDPREPVCVLVGPEGGFSAAEQRLAVSAGFLPASLGPTILRTELAAAAVLGALVAQAAARGTDCSTSVSLSAY